MTDGRSVRQLPRVYVAKRLLEHGPLTLREFREITGWPQSSCEAALKGLVRTRVAHFTEEIGCLTRMYHLSEAAQP